MPDLDIKLVHSKITSFEAAIAPDDDSEFSIEISFTAGVYGPNDESDNTTLIKVTCEANDENNKIVQIKCEADIIFEVALMQEDYLALLATNKGFRETIQRHVTQKIDELLRVMGQSLQIS